MIGYFKGCKLSAKRSRELKEYHLNKLEEVDAKISRQDEWETKLEYKQRLAGEWNHHFKLVVAHTKSNSIFKIVKSDLLAGLGKLRLVMSRLVIGKSNSHK